MTTTKILASTVIALAALASGSAFADSNYPASMAAPMQSSVTRAAVQADLVQAQKSGVIINDFKNYPMVSEMGASNSRADVRQALTQARQDGSIQNYRS